MQSHKKGQARVQGLEAQTNARATLGPNSVARWRLPKIHWLGRDTLLASFTLNLLALALPMVLLQVYDRIIPNQATGTLAALILGLAAALVLEAILRSMRSYLAGWAGAQFEHEASTQAVGKLLHADLAEIEREAAGVHLDRLGAIDPVRDFYANQAALLLVDLPFVVLFIGVLGLIGGWLALVPVILLGVFVATAYLLGERLGKALDQRADWDDRRYNFIIELLSGIHTVKGLALESLMLRRYERLLSSCVGTSYQTTFLASIAQGLGGLFSQLTMIAVASVGAIMVVGGSLSMGGLAAAILLGGRTVQPVLKAMSLWTQFQNIKLGKARLAKVFALTDETRQDAGALDGFSGKVEIEDLHFRFAEDMPDRLSGIDLTLEPGAFIGVSGANGCGKSTLLWSLMGGHRPHRGRILFDGVDIAGIDPVKLRQHVAFLPQRGVLFQGTVLDNLTLFRGDAYIEEAIGIANRLGLDRVFATLPDGFETRVGDAAADSLPGGVVQRIVIARALVGRPKLILFDEANTALDGESDARLRDLLAEMKGHSTIVLVSYRPSLLNLADRRFELVEGRLKEIVPRPAVPSVRETVS